jgi:hypothetical protein
MSLTQQSLLSLGSDGGQARRDRHFDGGTDRHAACRKARFKPAFTSDAGKAC